MKLLSEEILKEYGFYEDLAQSHSGIKIFTREKFEIVFKQNQYSYNNLGICYPLRDLAALKKLYKENKKTDLKPVAE
ncbi:MAG: hypothetical protein K0S26_1109 [Bacteroidota bacterium]|jgi:hypothetical protein|nr:hypothetical protein [Bacteroidota bacterium]